MTVNEFLLITKPHHRFLISIGMGDHAAAMIVVRHIYLTRLEFSEKDELMFANSIVKYSNNAFRTTHFSVMVSEINNEITREGEWYIIRFGQNIVKVRIDK